MSTIDFFELIMIMTHLTAAIVKNRCSFVRNIKVIKNYLMACKFVATYLVTGPLAKEVGYFDLVVVT